MWLAKGGNLECKDDEKKAKPNAINRNRFIINYIRIN